MPLRKQLLIFVLLVLWSGFAMPSFGQKTEARFEKQIDALETKLQRKNEVLSERMEEHIRLKKDLGEL